jgi:molybdenum cofactor cytidylyltransferase
VIGGIVLAAGGASRFGGRKQLAELHGRPLIEHAVEALRSVPEVERVVVVLGAEAGAIRSGADLGGAEVVVAEGWEEGISASLRAGVRALAETEAVLVTLADQPFVGPEVLRAILGQLGVPAPAARATYGGAPGHPVLIKRALYEEVERLRGDLGARYLLSAHGVTEVECGQLARPDDVDTPDDLEELRHAR